MRVLLCCNCCASPTPPLSRCSITPNPFINNQSLNWPQKTLIGSLTGALSFGLLFFSPSSLALNSQSPLSQPQPSSPEYCREEMFEKAPEPATNEGIVEEAWEIVNDSFLDTGRGRWSPKTWLVNLYRSHDNINIYYMFMVYGIGTGRVDTSCLLLFCFLFVFCKIWILDSLLAHVFSHTLFINNYSEIIISLIIDGYGIILYTYV